jgi:hydroxymethylpyrimidine pyrophosphatase-like HAD family hydrolase
MLTYAEQALELVGYAPGDCLVMGDGENDLEVLSLLALLAQKYKY